MSPNAKELGTLIHELRAERGLDLRSLAELCGVPAGTISRIENGLIAEPSPAKLQAIAQALEASLDDLYAAAGYTVPGGLPEMKLYLRAKYDVTPKVAKELEDYFRKRIEKEKGGRHGKRPR